MEHLALIVQLRPRRCEGGECARVYREPATGLRDLGRGTEELGFPAESDSVSPWPARLLKIAHCSFLTSQPAP